MKPILDRDAKQLCAVIREERAKELARAGMGNNAARKCCIIAVAPWRSSETIVKKQA